MDNPKPLFICLLFVLISPAISDSILETIATTGPPTGLNTAPNSSSLSCAQSLMSCQGYLHNPENDPPDLCCGPLRTMLAKDQKCLCDYFTDGPVLQSMKVPKENAVTLANACGSSPDTSACNNGTTNGSTTLPPPSPNNPIDAYHAGGAPMKRALGFGGSAIITVFASFIITSSIQLF